MKTLANFRNIKETVKHGYQVVCTSTKHKKYHGEKITPEVQVAKHVMGDHENHHIIMSTILKDKQGRTKVQRYKEKEAHYRLNNNRYENLFIRLKKQGNGEPILSDQQLHSIEELFHRIKLRKKSHDEKAGKNKKTIKLSAKQKLLMGLYKSIAFDSLNIEKSNKEPIYLDKIHNDKMKLFWNKYDNWFNKLQTESPVVKADRMENSMQIDILKKEEAKAKRAEFKKWIADMNKKNTIPVGVKNKKPEGKKQAKVVKPIITSPVVDYYICAEGSVTKHIEGYEEPQRQLVLLESTTAKTLEMALVEMQRLTDKWKEPMQIPFIGKASRFELTRIYERKSAYLDTVTNVIVNAPNKLVYTNLMSSEEKKKIGLTLAA